MASIVKRKSKYSVVYTCTDENGVKRQKWETFASQAEAKKRGYTETAWGRRRYLKHIQADKFEYKYNDKRPVDFNPLFTATSVVNKEVSQEIKDDYNSKLEKANFGQKRKIIETAKNEGIDITDNSGYIAESNRQVVNSIIQRISC